MIQLPSIRSSDCLHCSRAASSLLQRRPGICSIAITEEDTLEVAYPSLAKERGGDTKRANRSPEVPVFRANDLRGRLRRFAADVIFGKLLKRDQKISLEAYHGMTCGAVTGRPTPDLDFALAIKSGIHPFLGLFGGGPRMVRSSLQISPAWAITKPASSQIAMSRIASPMIGAS